MCDCKSFEWSQQHHSPLLGLMQSSMQMQLLFYFFSSSLITIWLQDLVSALKSELGGLLESLIVALMTPPVLFDASQLHKAVKVTDESSCGYIVAFIMSRVQKSSVQMSCICWVLHRYSVISCQNIKTENYLSHCTFKFIKGCKHVPRIVPKKVVLMSHYARYQHPALAHRNGKRPLLITWKAFLVDLRFGTCLNGLQPARIRPPEGVSGVPAPHRPFHLHH